VVSAAGVFFGETVHGRRWWLEGLGGLLILMVREREWRAGSYLFEGRESCGKA
jgi:hypothetical protein